ncbi:MAG: hypothetical protein KAV82_14675 [Phycisphaerae bacterium]|nr:hypothetical protein [Phycisphaerae bacterium]
MIHEKAQRVADLAQQLTAALMTAAICADEIRAIVQVELDSHTAVGWGRSQDAKHRNPPPQRPLVDSSTFSVYWAGRTCSLRRTILFQSFRGSAGAVAGRPGMPTTRPKRASYARFTGPGRRPVMPVQ